MAKKIEKNELTHTSISRGTSRRWRKEKRKCVTEYRKRNMMIKNIEKLKEIIRGMISVI